MCVCQLTVGGQILSLFLSVSLHLCLSLWGSFQMAVVKFTCSFVRQAAMLFIPAQCNAPIETSPLFFLTHQTKCFVRVCGLHFEGLQNYIFTDSMSQLVLWMHGLEVQQIG